MGHGKEVSRYLGSVVLRTTGVDGFLHGRHTALNSSNPAMNEEPSPTLWGSMVGGAQLLLPDFARPIMHSTTSNSSYTKDGALGGLGIGLDLALWAATIVNTQDQDPKMWILKIAALRLATNAVTQVGLDLAGRAVDRLRGFRPPAPATLAV